MKMHGKLLSQQSKLVLVEIEGRHKWLHSAHLGFEMESLICVAQEQVVANNVMKAKMWKQGGSSLCRLFQKHDEIIMHIVIGCEMLCRMKELNRHDKTGTDIH